MMDSMISSNVNVYTDHHLQAWKSATEAKLAAGRKLMAALQEHYPSSPISPPQEPLAFFPKQPPTDNAMPHRSEIPPPQTNFPGDVVFYVGKSRQTFHLNAQSLISGSAYFTNVLQHAHSPSSPTGWQASPGGFAQPPIVIDCEEGIFESLLLLMRYGSLAALPPMSAAEIFRLKKEAEFYGIHYTEPPSKSRAADSGDGGSDMSSKRSQSSSPSSGSPKSMMNRLSPPVADKGGLYHEGVRLACNTPRRLAELLEFPGELADPARLVLVSCLDQDKASIYTCDCRKQAPGSRRTQWALNFHHRHAFCTSCGHRPNVSPKHFSEMFMAAAADYYTPASPGQAAPAEPNCAWQVSSDSTCMLRFISGDGRDACGCTAGGGRAAKEAPPTIWAANCFYSHAFCTRCGEVAKGPVLLSLISAVRFGGRSPRFSFS